MINTTNLTIEDLIAASFAMESWLDAFGDDPDFEEDADRVRKVLGRIKRFVKQNPRPHLMLVPKPDGEQ